MQISFSMINMNRIMNCENASIIIIVPLIFIPRTLTMIAINVLMINKNNNSSSLIQFWWNFATCCRSPKIQNHAAAAAHNIILYYRLWSYNKSFDKLITIIKSFIDELIITMQLKNASEIILPCIMSMQKMMTICGNSLIM